MATKITQEDILAINRAYQRIGTYAGAARELGFSAGTIKKYIVKDFIDPDTIQIKKFSSIIPKLEDMESINWNLTLTKEEQEEIEELWKEISL